MQLPADNGSGAGQVRRTVIMICVNLIPTRRRHDRILRARRKRWVLGAAGYTLALACAYAGWRVAWHEDGLDLTHQLTLLQSDIDDGTRSIAKLRAAIRDAQWTIRATQAVNGQPDWSLLLALISQMKGDQIVLNRCALSVSPKTAGLPASVAAAQSSAGMDPGSPASLQLQGYGRSQAAVSQLLLGLERTGLFEAVALLKTNRETFVGGEAMAFRIECQLKSVFAEVPSLKSKTVPAGKLPRAGSVADLSEAGGAAR